MNEGNELRTLLTEEIRDVYRSSIIVGIMKYMKMRWTDHTATMGRQEMYTKFL